MPRGITAEQWPLDPVSGYPMMHGFTLYLPEEYRVHGPDIVALSFFATAADHNDGGARPRDDLFAAVLAMPPIERPEDPALWPFREHARKAHPRLHRMTDALGYAYAVILLTQSEFDGDSCPPPDLAGNPYLRANARPGWLQHGSAYDFFESTGGLGRGDLPSEYTFSYRILGAEPEKRLDWHRAIACNPRPTDPNAGIPPCDTHGDPSPHGYQPYFFYEGDRADASAYRIKPWAEGHEPDHIGGTMRPVQATPAFSPYFVGFEEYFGGYNFGGGNAQLDFLKMQFDWACG